MYVYQKEHKTLKRKRSDLELQLWILITVAAVAVVVSDIGFYVSSDPNHKEKLNSKRLFIRADRLIFVTSLHRCNSNKRTHSSKCNCLHSLIPKFIFHSHFFSISFGISSFFYCHIHFLTIFYCLQNKGMNEKSLS